MAKLYTVEITRRKIVKVFASDEDLAVEKAAQDERDEPCDRLEDVQVTRVENVREF